MRVLLVISPWSYQTIHPGKMGRQSIINRLIGTVGGPTEPLGLLYIAAFLQERGHQVLLSDGAMDTEEQVLDIIRTEQPGIVGLSAMKHNWPSTRALIARIRHAAPQVPIVLGGPQATCWGEENFEECPQLDYLVSGEGEHAMAELCQAVESGHGEEKISGLMWRRQGEVVVNPARKPMKDLDAIPLPDYSLVDLSRYRPSVGFYNKLPSMNLITSRGCPYKCTFCISEGRMQLRSVHSVIEEIGLMRARYGIRHITFYDEGITFSRRRITRLCEELIRRQWGISWCANARVDQVDREMLSMMKRAGCWKLLYGLESGVQKNLDAIHKRTTVEQSARAIQLTTEAGIETFATFLFGIPGETFAEGVQTIDFACKLKLDYAAFLNLVPYKGSEIYDNIDKYGTLTGKWSTNLISFVPHSMTFEELRTLNVLAAKRFFRRPTYLLRRLAAIRTLEDVKRNLRGFLAFNTIKSSDYDEEP